MFYDENCYINTDAEIYEVNIVSKEQQQPKSNYHNSDHIEAYIQEIEQMATDITGNYETWLNLGFALFEEYGEVGRDYFHRISRFHPNHNYQECDKQFTNCINAKGTGINISTFYYMAKQHNINPYEYEETSESQTFEDIQFNQSSTAMPTFSKPLIPQLPQFLQQVVVHTKTDHETDIMILGALTTVSACSPKVYGIYDGFKIYSNLFLFVSASAVSGKEN